MNRREALSRVALLMGGTLSAPTLMAFGNNPATLNTSADFVLNDAQRALVSEIADIIIPRTSTPGAKDAKVGPFIELMLKDCYRAQEQQNFVEGLADADARAMKVHNKKFLETTPAEQTALLTQIEKDTMELMKNANVKQVKVGDNVDKEVVEGKKLKGTPFWRLMKELTLFGYFTSEEGATKALNYVPIPGKYEGCIPYKKGDKAYAL
ncbi:MAG: gluconate 2-dehydrogenase subunit 3 family protein [Cytophagia bacterium]|nr:MAG: gluconate 2-dehydrogenase subunit 3 family protein [Runella sp.]TAG22409.1 MAG: gluconate 2-dehydrogenase subunit 3 family protein [Cytophagales bacterium]TAG41439.1 MAG: gluconate 2-dehydrogenase subunit 3 family protein [Cytophagia bacterium]TAG52953.1 MAG: gluconate 2-dehydrogenase subunit 3 family protein [Runella slithyformis]TAG70530.1 MAG: gluconate 2-dehydrogenase subunit 3 family protein [Runella slithyformis]